jgi:hypothetical protein
MNRWLTWRARLAHLLDPRTECLCHVCARARAPARSGVGELAKNQFRVGGSIAPPSSGERWGREE